MDTVRCVVAESSQVGEARRTVQKLAHDTGFDETQIGRMVIVATELGNNLLQHAGGGELLVQTSAGAGAPYGRVFALDKGPGMGNVEQCFVDGYSTASTPGTGLGAVRRMSASVEVFSMPGGTAILAAFGTAPRLAGVDWFGLNVAKEGEPVSGDNGCVKSSGESALFVLCDGLGHGIYAAEASRAACSAVGTSYTPELQPADALERVHAALRSTRGAAAAVARVDWRYEKVVFAGVGNISACVINPAGQVRRLVSMNGTLGHSVRKFQAFDYPLGGPITLIMHSDGVATHWNLERYPGLLHKSPALIAAVLMRDFVRGRDDASILVARQGEGA